MQALALFMIFAVTVSGILADNGWLPGSARFLPEMLSALVVVVVVVLGVRDRFRYVRVEFWAIFVALLLSMVAGVVANAVDSGPVFAGIRAYLRAVPLFFLAAVYPFSDREVRQQLTALLVVALVQAPLAAYQKMHELSFGNTSGDAVYGTFGNAGVVSVFLFAVACVITGFYVRRLIGVWAWGTLMILTLLPTAINETKAIVFMLPAALLVTFWVGAPPSRRLRSLGSALAVIVALGAIIVPTFDYLQAQRPESEGGGFTLYEFFTNERQLDRYVNARSEELGGAPGRGLAYRLAIDSALEDPVAAVFGRGIGNASKSSLGQGFSGEFDSRFRLIIQSSGILFLVELGLLGIVLLLLLHALVLFDASALARSSAGMWGALGVGWAGVTTVVVLSCLYTDPVVSPGISYLYWYFSGLLAAHRVRATLQVPQRPAMLQAASLSRET